ncbi:MAG: bifunctional UDP-N-acetylglucosamine diphosphorylase/glucosamine-1-phosphate N-acetyltransferase GlmU [Pseudomonadota bacterium]
MNAHSVSAHAVILAAGEGTRMNSPLPKVLHQVAHKSLLAHVMDAALAANIGSIGLVLGHQGDQVSAEMSAFGYRFTATSQTERLGTGHAMMTVRDAGHLPGGALIVLLGDAPLITPTVIERAFQGLQQGADIVVLGFDAANPTGYGRLIVEGGQLTGIIEEKDASSDQKNITLCNSGVMAFGAGVLEPLLGQLSNDNAKGEYYLTDTIGLANDSDLSVTFALAQESELRGVNTLIDLAEAEADYQQRRRAKLMLSGVVMQAPHTVFLAHDTVLEPGALVEPNVVFGPNVHVKSGAIIKAFSHLEGALVASGASVGPYARLRPGTELRESAKVGNFCETKNAKVGEGAKINHLSYIGDAAIGARANIGAGTITCNYDGVNKHQTLIGESAFIGSNSALVAPVEVESGGYVGSGSVITKTVEAGDLAIARGRQVNLKGRAPKLKK